MAKKTELKKTASQVALEKANKLKVEARAKVEKAKKLENGKIKCVVAKDCGKKFGSELIQDGSEINLPSETATELLALGFITVK